MGYESKIYIVNKTDSIFGDEPKKYASVIATFDLCKMGYGGFTQLFNKETDCYFYADDGNTKILEDCYGDSLKECDIKELKEWFKNKIKEDDYRRLKPFYALVKSFNKKQWKDLAIIHYGH